MTRPLPFALPFLAVLALVGCGTSSNATAPKPDASTGDDSGADAGPLDSGVDAPPDTGVFAESPSDLSLIAARPYESYTPAGYDSTKPTPMILLLHGYGATGVLQFQYFGFAKLAAAQNLFVAYPDGTVDSSGSQYWHATDACCAPAGSTLDDVTYLTAVVHDMQAKFNIDPKRIWVVGHSNGGFMTHRLGCDRSELFAAGVSLAGAQWEDPSNCQPTRPFPIAEVHGTADQTIFYDGGVTTKVDGVTKTPYPSAPTTVADWATIDGCTSPLTQTGQTMSVDFEIPGNETSVANYTGCSGASAVELWTVDGGVHEPSIDPTWGMDVYTFLSAHPMP